MAETTNQTQKLYGFDTWHLGKITEYDVVKETAKTYVVARTGEPSFNGRRHTNTVRKAEMSFYDTRLATSRAAAPRACLVRRTTASLISACWLTHSDASAGELRWSRVARGEARPRCA